MYIVPSSAPSCSAIVPYFLHPQSLLHILPTRSYCIGTDPEFSSRSCVHNLLGPSVGSRTTVHAGLRSPTKNSVSAACPFHLPSRHQFLNVGKITFNITLNHPSSCFLQFSALSKAKSSHYTWECSHTTLPTVPSSSHTPSGSNINLFDAGTSVGGMVKGNGMEENGCAQTGNASTSILDQSVRTSQFIDFPTFVFMACRVAVSDGASLFYATP